MGVYGTTIITGATPVVNGTSGRILYNNSSAVGEMTTSGSGTVVALVTNPVFPASITVGAAAGATGTILFNGTTSGTVTLSTADAAGTWTMKLPTSAGTNTYLLQTDGSGNTSWVAPPSGGLTIGTTTITSGTNGRILYDNSGVVGEATVTGTLGSVVLSDSPSLTTVATLTRTSVGTTSADGLVLTNTTAAAAGAQQYSPRLRLTGQGWKTNATAASQTVDWIIENQPVQGAAAPTTNLIIASQINAGGYTTQLQLSGGTVSTSESGITGFAGFASTGATTSGFFIGSGGGNPTVQIQRSGNGHLRINGTTCAILNSLAITSDIANPESNGAWLYVDAANILAQRNSTNAQTFRVYGTTTGSKYVTITHNGTDGTINTSAGKLNLSAFAGSTTYIGNNSAGSSIAVSTGGSSQTATSGTYITNEITGSFAPSSTSTMVSIPLHINPTINYSAGTPGAGSYQALRIAVVETALPTGTNYLIHANAGASGTTARFLVESANGALTACAGTAIPAGGATGSGLKVSSTANFGVFFGSGAPSLSAAKGSMYLRSDGSGTTDRAYINTDGGTTWTALTTVA